MTSSVAGGGGVGIFDSASASGRTWGSAKDRGKIRLLQSHHLFRSLDVTVSTVTNHHHHPPVQVNRLTDSPSPIALAPKSHRWSESAAAFHSLPHPSLWSTTIEDDEASLSCDSLDHSSTHAAIGVPSASSPSPPTCPTPRKRWQSPAPTSRSNNRLDYIEPLDLLNVQQQKQQQQRQPRQQDEEEFHPRFVSWELPFNSQRSGHCKLGKPWVRVHPRMRSEVNPPASHKCDLKAHRRCKPRSRPSSRERTPANDGGVGNNNNSGPDSMPEMANRSNAKSKWTRRVSVQQLLPSKTRFSSSSSSLDVRADAQSGRGTRSFTDCMISDANQIQRAWGGKIKWQLRRECDVGHGGKKNWGRSSVGMISTCFVNLLLFL